MYGLPVPPSSTPSSTVLDRQSICNLVCNNFAWRWHIKWLHSTVFITRSGIFTVRPFGCEHKWKEFYEGPSEHLMNNFRINYDIWFVRTHSMSIYVWVCHGSGWPAGQGGEGFEGMSGLQYLQYECPVHKWRDMDTFGWRDVITTCIARTHTHTHEFMCYHPQSTPTWIFLQYHY